MLRLKRRSSNAVSIVVHAKTRPPRRYLFRGIMFALLFHIVLLFFFQIRVQYVEEDASQTNAPMVYLDLDDEPSILTEEFSSAEDFAGKLTRELHLRKNPFSCAPEIVSYDEAPPTIELSRAPAVTLLPWSLSDSLSPSHYTLHAYPLKITLRNQLRKLYFVNDGSELFKKATYETIFTTPFFTETQPKVDFRIDVSLKTGKITRLICLRELVDKRLQEIALKLLETFQFASTRNEDSDIVSGEIVLQFCGTFETIEPLLKLEGQE